MTYRIDFYADHTAAPQSLTLTDTTEERADAVASAIHKASGPEAWVDVWEVRPDGTTALTGWFRTHSVEA